MKLSLKLHKDPKVELLRTLPVFAACSTAELGEIATHADEIILPVGDRLTTEGAIGHEFIVILEGSADVFKHEALVATLGPGDFVGEIALLTGERRTASVVAKTPVRALVIVGHEFKALIRNATSMRTAVESVVPERQES